MKSSDPSLDASNNCPIPKILAAAKQCYLENGINKTGMAEVSKIAGIARSTLYRYFSTKEEVLAEVIKTEIIDANSVVNTRLVHCIDPAEYIVDGFIIALKEIPQRKLLYSILLSDNDSMAKKVLWNSDVILKFGQDMIQRVIEPALANQQLEDKVSPEILIEWMYRILLSFLTMPSQRIQTDEEIRTVLKALLIPVLFKGR